MKATFLGIGKFCAYVSVITSTLGAGLNYIVEKANDGFMPVFDSITCFMIPGAQLDYRHICGTPATHLAFLADWISMGPATYSPGDFFLIASWNLSYIAAVFLTTGLVIRSIKRLSV